MRKFLAWVLIALLVTSCALSDAIAPASPTTVGKAGPTSAAPRANTDALATQAAATPTAVANATQPPAVNVPVATPTRSANPPATATTPSNANPPAAAATPSGDPTLAFVQALSGQAAYEHTRALTTKEMAGRKAGADGGNLAAQYIADKFKAAGLKPIGDNNTYFQNFMMPFVDLSDLSLQLKDANGAIKQTFKHRVDYRESAAWLSENGKAEGMLVFLGRGTDKDFALAGDLTGKIALVFQPPNTRPDVWIKGVLDRGLAGALVITSNPESVVFKSSYVVNAARKGETHPLLVVTRETAEKLLQGSSADLQALEDKTKADEGAFLATQNRVALTMQLALVRDVKVMNVIGAIAGSDPALTNEVIIVGGHYDHIGYDPAGGALYDGANDNASGTAVVIALAEHFMRSGIKPKRTLVFAAWTAEESGLVGSDYYVKHPIYPLDKTLAYINLDVVGAGEGTGLTVTADSRDLSDLAKGSAADLGVKTGGTSIGGGSDHESFLKARVPATFFIWQNYGEIHVPSDTLSKIDPEKLKTTGQVAALTMMRLANR